ncbi:MAG: PIN domain-containing protein, partial [Myxococcaceae bacterium]
SDARSAKELMVVRRVLVDTSVFVEFLRGRAVPRFEASIRSNSALLSPYVRLELLQGVQKKELVLRARLLSGIPQTPSSPEVFRVAEEMLGKLKGRGLTVGIVDLLLAAEARLLRCRLLSFDGVFQKLEKLGLVENLR